MLLHVWRLPVWMCVRVCQVFVLVMKAKALRLSRLMQAFIDPKAAWHLPIPSSKSDDLKLLLTHICVSLWALSCVGECTGG